VSRLEQLLPDRLDARQRELYQRISGGKRANDAFRIVEDDGSLTGPFNLFLHAPTTGTALSAVGEAIRYGSGLSPRIRELAILSVAGHRDSEFERYAHELVGRSVGITDTELTTLRELGELALEDPAEAAAYDFCREALRRRAVSDEVFERALEHLGEERTVELTALLAYYDGLSLLLSVFEIRAPEDLG
jgi:4-carboxymuconolactone decarboxylase